MTVNKNYDELIASLYVSVLFLVIHVSDLWFIYIYFMVK
jgi:hypothetical protein